MAQGNRIVRGAVNPPRRGYGTLRPVDQPLLPEPKSKRDRFVEIINRRVGNLIIGFDELCKTADRETYEATEADIEKIVGALAEQVERVKDSFAVGKKVSTFRLER